MKDQDLLYMAERWRKIDDDDLALYLEKARDYGSVDLRIMGAALVESFGVKPAQAVEAAIGFYALGKIARVLGACAEGREPNVDSWRDLRIYATMAILDRGNR